MSEGLQENIWAQRASADKIIRKYDDSVWVNNYSDINEMTHTVMWDCAPSRNTHINHCERQDHGTRICVEPQLIMLFN